MQRIEWLINTRSEITAGVNILSQFTYETCKEKNIKTVNELTKHKSESPKKGLKYKTENKNSIQCQ